jgi:hypothetical protein
MTMDGYIACEVYSGAVNADTFNAFVEHQLIPALRDVDPDREWIIVMNNASIHKSDVCSLITVLTVGTQRLD